jgi:argininosuccinate lyase
MFTLNRLACDLLLFTTREFGFATLPEELCTGSSMMPQKRNPDVLELVRASYSVVLAREFEVRSLIGNLTSGYQRDLGLTKAPLFAAHDTTAASLDMMHRVVEGFVLNEEACLAALTPELLATEEANRLVAEGLSFRDAYRQVADRLRASAESGTVPGESDSNSETGERS